MNGDDFCLGGDDDLFLNGDELYLKGDELYINGDGKYFIGELLSGARSIEYLDFEPKFMIFDFMLSSFWGFVKYDGIWCELSVKMFFVWT